MRFKITLVPETDRPVMPINYQYPLSAAIYKVIAKGDAEYASFLHETGYGKGFKFFTFSQINCPFKIEGDRLRLLGNEMNFQVAFHLPQAMESFVKGLFQSESIEIADRKSKAVFKVQSVESLPNLLADKKENELVSVQLKPLSPIVVGDKQENGNYNFLEPADPKFAENIIYNWRSKIASCYDQAIADAALLMTEVIPMNKPFKSRLITIKEGKPEETQIRGWLFLFLKVTAEKRFVELMLNAGAGLYNAQGMGGVEIEGLKD